MDKYFSSLRSTQLCLFVLVGAMMATLMAAQLGCSDSPVRYSVAGKVLIDGEPLTTGSIRFVPEKGRPFTSTIMKDGSFELSENALSVEQKQLGVFPGNYQVAVSATKILSEDSNDVKWLAPSKYADFRTSGIEVEVTQPIDDLRIELTWDGDENTEDVSADDAPQADTKTESAKTTDDSTSKNSLDATAPVEEAPAPL